MLEISEGNQKPQELVKKNHLLEDDMLGPVGIELLPEYFWCRYTFPLSGLYPGATIHS